MKSTKSNVPKFTKGRPNTPQKVAYTYKSKLKAAKDGRKNNSKHSKTISGGGGVADTPFRNDKTYDRSRPNTAQGLNKHNSRTNNRPISSSTSRLGISTPGSMSQTSNQSRVFTPLEMTEQGLEWVPPCRYEKGYWRKKKRHSSKLKADTMMRLTRPRTQAGSRPPGSSASGRWLRPGGGRFSSAKPKSEIDWIILRAQQTPAPNQYAGVKYEWGKGGIKISDANPKSEVEWVIYRSKRTPGPNAYNQDLPPSTGLSGGRFSTAFPKSYLDWTKYRAEQIPGPSEYKIDLCPMTPGTSKKWVGELLMEKRKHFRKRATLRKERNKRFISPVKR
jgi:hypothetical protein